MEKKYTLVTANAPEFTAVEPVTFDDAKALYAAVNNPTADMEDMVDQKITIANIHMTMEERIDDDGQPYVKYSTSIITPDGKSYTCSYKRFAKSCVQILNMFGTPDTWEKPLTVIPRRLKFGGGLHNTIILDIA